MTKETMNVHKALSELKINDQRIFDEIATATFVRANKHSNEKIAGIPIADYKERMKASHQKITALINRGNAMKRAVVLSNAITKVEIIGRQYTVAEAIDMKNHGLDNLKRLLSAMQQQYRNAQNELEKYSGDQLERKAESYILSVINAQPKDGKMSADSDEMKNLRKAYIENNTFDLVDPLDVLKKIEELQDFIAKFESEVDAALSVSNALTIIEFEY